MVEKTLKNNRKSSYHLCSEGFKKFNVFSHFTMDTPNIFQADDGKG